MIVLSVIAMLAGLLPLPLSAGAGSVRPPAVSFNISLQGGASDTHFDLNVTGAANQTGEFDLTLTVNQPEQHTLRLIHVGDTVYESEDSGPFQASTDTASALAGVSGPFSLGGLGQPNSAALSPDCVSAQSALRSLFQPGALGIQSVGSEVIDGAQTDHVQGTIDLGSALADPQVSTAFGQVLSACEAAAAPSTAQPALDPALLQELPLVLGGSTLTVDAYLDQPTGLPRKFTLSLDLPVASLQLSATGQVTPLSAPAAIAAPAQP